MATYFQELSIGENWQELEQENEAPVERQTSKNHSTKDHKTEVIVIESDDDDDGTTLCPAKVANCEKSEQDIPKKDLPFCLSVGTETQQANQTNITMPFNGEKFFMNKVSCLFSFHILFLF